MTGCVTAQVGGVAEQLTVTLRLAEGSVQATVLGNWICSVLAELAAKSTEKVAVPPETCTVLGDRAPDRVTLVPLGAFVVTVTSYWKPSTHECVLSSAIVRVAPAAGAVNATV